MIKANTRPEGGRLVTAVVGRGRLLSVRPPGGKSDLERLMRASWELSTVRR